MDHQHVRHVRHHRDRPQVFLVVVVQLEHVRRDRLRTVRRDEQRITVRRRFRDELRADVAAGAGAVLHEHALSERCAHVLRERSRDDVVAARPCRIGDHEPHRLRRIVLRRHDATEHQEHDRRNAAHLHPFLLSVLP
jgi:hypothetical protein